jgi:hypothetical protein
VGIIRKGLMSWTPGSYAPTPTPSPRSSTATAPTAAATLLPDPDEGLAAVKVPHKLRVVQLLDGVLHVVLVAILHHAISWGTPHRQQTARQRERPAFRE